MHLMASLAIAFATYSRIPTPRVEWSQENRRYSLCFFPLIGAAIGGALAAWLWLCDALCLGALLRGAVGAGIPLLITGGIHMDGFMDTCDALSSWQTKERRLEILKDSHVGAFAVMGCCAYLLLAAGLLGEARAQDAPMLAMVFVASRALSAATSVALPSARPDGMLGSMTQRAKRRAILASSAVYVAACVGLWAAAGGALALLCAGTAALCALYYRRMANREFGGVTGDLAGWLLQTTELALFAVVIIGGKLL